MTICRVLSFILTHDARSHFASGALVVEMSLLEMNLSDVCLFTERVYNRPGFMFSAAEATKALMWLFPIP
jgi:hypothetical protein